MRVLTTVRITKVQHYNEIGLKALPTERGEVKPVDCPLVDDRPRVLKSNGRKKQEKRGGKCASKAAKSLAQRQFTICSLLCFIVYCQVPFNVCQLIMAPICLHCSCTIVQDKITACFVLEELNILKSSHITFCTFTPCS